jgi:hypothetical protein
LVCAVGSQAWDRPQNAPKTPAQDSSQPESGTTSAAPAIPVDQANARKAKDLVDQAIEALGGQAYLNIRDREQQGRRFGFHHGQSSGNGTLFWSFAEFPDKERVEYTKERDVARLYVGDKAWEITYKGPHPIEEKDRADYLRLRHFSLETILRTWVKDPGVIFLYEGNATASQRPALRVTLISPKNEAVSLFFDSDTHLPIQKSFEWRDPVDRQKNLEEEVYENYRQVSGVMVPYNVTRFYNGDMSAESFLFSVTFNQSLDHSMFDPNSGYNPNKQPSKH